VLALAGRADEAREAIAAAIGIYRAKGDIVSTARATAWMRSLG
jgi:hypothetical protein